MTSSTALIVIDAQESFRHRPYYKDDEMPAFTDRIITLAEGFRAKKLPVVRIFHVENEGAFALTSGHVRPLPGLDFPVDATFQKTVHSALVGTGLLPWLIGHGIGRLAITGIRTEQCCETTTRHASDLGFKVDFVTEATLTFAFKHPNGRLFSPAEIRERTELVLAHRFANVCSAEEALANANADPDAVIAGEEPIAGRTRDD